MVSRDFVPMVCEDAPGAVLNGQAATRCGPCTGAANEHILRELFEAAAAIDDQGHELTASHGSMGSDLARFDLLDLRISGAFEFQCNLFHGLANAADKALTTATAQL